MIAPSTAEKFLEVSASCCSPTLKISTRDDGFGTQ